MSCAVPAEPQQIDLAARRDEVRARETAFARSMADRDLGAFTSFIAPEAVFVGVGGTTRGPQEIAAAWKRFFDGPDAPFSWKPETVEVLRVGDAGHVERTGLRPARGTRIGTLQLHLAAGCRRRVADHLRQRLPVIV